MYLPIWFSNLLYAFIGLSYFSTDRTCFIPRMFYSMSDFDENQMEFISACFWKVGAVNNFKVDEFPTDFSKGYRAETMTDYCLSIRILRRVRVAFTSRRDYMCGYVEMLDHIEEWFSSHELSLNPNFKRLLYDLRAMKVNILNVGPMNFFGRERIEEVLLTRDKELTKFVYVRSFNIIKSEVLDIW